MIEQLYHMGEAVSIALTFVTLHLCLEVNRLWLVKAYEFLRGHREAVGWVAFGVVVHFTGSFWDNTFWGYTWDLKYKGDPAYLEWFKNGVWANIPFRQLATSVAGYCYVRGSYLFLGIPLGTFHLRLLLSLTIGITYVTIIAPAML